MNKKCVVLMLCAALGMFGTACGDKTPASAEAKAEATTSMTGALDAASTATVTALGSLALTVQATVQIEEETVDCEGGGTLTVGGSYTESSFTINAALTDCGETNLGGTLSMTVAYALSDDNDTYETNVRVDAGLADDGCDSVDMDFTIVAVTSADTSETTSSTMSGSADATCGDESVECNFSNIDLMGTEAEIEAAVNESCN